MPSAHIRQLDNCRKALAEPIEDYRRIQHAGFRLQSKKDIIEAIQPAHLTLTSVAYLKAIVDVLEKDGGSRCSYLVVADDGTQIHPTVIDKATVKPLRFKPENKSLRDSILRIKYDPQPDHLFTCETVPVRKAAIESKAFEPAWRYFRKGQIYNY